MPTEKGGAPRGLTSGWPALPPSTIRSLCWSICLVRSTWLLNPWSCKDSRLSVIKWSALSIALMREKVSMKPSSTPQMSRELHCSCASQTVVSAKHARRERDRQVLGDWSRESCPRARCVTARVVDAVISRICETIHSVCTRSQSLQMPATRSV